MSNSYSWKVFTLNSLKKISQPNLKMMSPLKRKRNERDPDPVTGIEDTEIESDQGRGNENDHVTSQLKVLSFFSKNWVWNELMANSRVLKPGDSGKTSKH